MTGPQSTTAPVLELVGIARSFAQGGRRLEVFHDVSIALAPGEIVALVGPSGAGKSSLLHIAGLLEAPDTGDVMIRGQSTAAMTDNARSRLRRGAVGFIYQFHHLLPEFTALENVVMPQLIGGVARATARERANHLLKGFGLDDRLVHRPGELSGGEQQRVAIARALANRPDVLLADEPTGNLDPQTADQVFADLVAMAREQGLAALIATHNYELAKRMDRTMTLVNGRIEAVQLPA